jgi:uncharacterized OB-fold protein
MSETQKVAVAKCPNCGYVYGDDLEYRFPEPSVCSCGTETDNTTVANIDTVRSLAADQGNGGDRA